MTSADDGPEQDPQDLGSLLGGLGGDVGGLGDLLAGAQRAMDASRAAALTEVEGSAGGGMVRIRANGGGEILGVTIDRRAVDPADVEGLEDLVLAALRDVNNLVARVHADAMGGFDPAGMLGGILGEEE